MAVALLLADYDVNGLVGVLTNFSKGNKSKQIGKKPVLILLDL